MNLVHEKTVNLNKMPDPITYQSYQAYVVNVKDFLTAETEIRRIINRALKSNKQNTIKVLTKVYALVYSTFAEANFMKMILTPYGFEQSFIDDILKENNNLQQKWLKCVELGFAKFSKSRKGSEVPNKILELKTIIQEYIIDPSILRNKLAHGQFSIALNNKISKVNSEITSKINSIDVVSIQRLFKVNQMLCSILEDLIESPDVAHNHNYYTKFQELESFIKRSETWTINTKLLTHSMAKPRI
jgi:hypothetical protein